MNQVEKMVLAGMLYFGECTARFAEHFTREFADSMSRCRHYDAARLAHDISLMYEDIKLTCAEWRKYKL